MNTIIYLHNNVHFHFLFPRTVPYPQPFGIVQKCTVISTYTRISVQFNVHDLSCSEMRVCFLGFYCCYYYFLYENILSNKNTNTYTIYMDSGTYSATCSHPSSRTMGIRHRKVFVKLRNPNWQTPNLTELAICRQITFHSSAVSFLVRGGGSAITITFTRTFLTEQVLPNTTALGYSCCRCFRLYYGISCKIETPLS